ncbi:hypothetical protein BGZ61DRAFT_346626 [Ilyonectria robusta]|uniref:uncharacterized protein n=1 Tax=Ilyonectria robusta TaxID=1079257 RepID=UPI001E8D1A00|nr:uncharacterized protein BGZ61DRAFT_346626 [Ilyonectria robusta]KAH8729454.1 hypothetical protein BGZ61DRAFT_346626 [Ilyonectria robusta]
MPHTRDADSASSSGQSKRPPLNHQESDSQSDTSGLQHQQQHHRQHHRHQRHHPVGRLHTARAPAAKTAPKQPKLHRRHTSPPDSEAQQLRTSASTSTAGASASSHRRAASDVRLSSRDSSSANLTKSPSHSKLKRNRSHVEVAKRSKSSDKLKRAASTTIVYQARAASNRNQVHFDLGTDGQDDEWVDASGSNSPYLSRKGSLNSSAHSSLPQGASAASSRPVTPNEPDEPQQPDMSSPERARAHHKEYLTSRLLQRTPSHGAPPQMTADLAQVAPRQFTPASPDDPDSTTLMGSTQDELTSRFVEAAGSGLTSEGSFYRPPRGDFSRYDETNRKPRSIASLPAGRDVPEIALAADEVDDSALAPKAPRRTVAPSAQASRTQQKLNLQRASSVIEPGQAVSGVGGVVGANSGMGVGGPGYDGGGSRDPRISKLLERTGLEYLVVRRYQNSVSRSLDRLSQLPGLEKSQRIPRINTAAANGKRTADLTMRHARNVSMPDARRPVTPRRANSIRTNGAASSFDGEDETRLNERLSGSSLVGGSEEDGTAAVLRNLWEKSMELSASH